MEQINLPTKIEYYPDPENKNKAQMVIEPCYPGYGITWGNAMRRVLLSSLPGAAVNDIKIKGARHEFSTIPNVKEDVLQVVLNLKMLRLKLFTDEPVKLKLITKGEKKVTAADFEKNANVEIVNPDLHLATLTDKKAELEIEATIIRGYGYISAEEKDRTGLDLGTIVIDSIFTPIVKVAFQVDNVRFGKRTDYDKLNFTIETDGTVTPKQALVESASLLASHFTFLTESINAIEDQSEEKPKVEKKTAKKKKAKTTKKKK